MSGSLKARTAQTIKWNTIDRLASQVAYAVVGVVLANILSKEDFGLAGAILVFQAFALILVDSGFGSALLQKKNTSEKDYSTVFWFNLAIAVAIYFILWFAAPLIAALFQHDDRLIPLSRVMFLAFVLNGLGIVQTNRLMKKMDVKQVAVSNLVALTLSGILAIFLALGGWGPWALVWQAVAQAALRSGWLWLACHWRPQWIFSMESIKSIWRVGLGVLSSQFLNTLFLNIYSFIIGACYNLAALGVFTQADKWSKMGSASLSQIFTSSFVPLLAKVQDSPDDFRRYMKKVNKFSAFLTFPFLLGLALVATPLFHTLFGQKWDEAIPLFQLLCFRGVFVVLVSLYGNYLLALGHARSLVKIEMVKDGMVIAAILATVFLDSVFWLVVGQCAASVFTFLYVMWLMCRNTGYTVSALLLDNAPYAVLTAAICMVMWLAGAPIGTPWLKLIVELTGALVIYVGILKISGSRILDDVWQWLAHRAA